MNGFLERALAARKECADQLDPECANGSGQDVLGYHTGSDIPNYWAYARHFVLQDHFFEPSTRGASRSICTWSQAGRRNARAPTR